MTFLQRLLSQTSSLSPDEERYWMTQYGGISNAGIPIDSDSALKISTAWRCSRLISETVAMLPRIVYRRLEDGGKERSANHPVYSLIHDQPNRKQTSFEFFDMMQMHTLNRGNAFAKIVPGPRGPVDRLIPIHPDRVEIQEVDEDTLRYVVMEKNGIPKIYNDDEILHIRGLTLDGTNGVSVIRYARESLGLTLAAERYGAKLFSNASRASGYLKHPGVLSEAAQKRLVEQQERMTGGENLHRLGILEEGMEFQQVSFTPEDSQMLQTREFQAEDVARWYGVPPHMIGLTSKTTSWGSGIEELSRGFVTFVLMPWLIRWQQVIEKDLIIASEQYFVEFLTEALLRGDIEKRYKSYSTGRQWGWLATNEIRRAENLNPIEGGDDDYLTPLNMEKSDDADINGEPNPASGAHYDQLLRESAARVVRKEIAAMNRAGKREGLDWGNAVTEFFNTHADFVSETMCMPREKAVWFVEFGRSELLEKGLAAMEDWETDRIAVLFALAKEQA